mmetsp:Transcript_11135/g.29615  ORF Transcript_11135/g.29615 Transcript_11135/m.29615 type:complete len:238 (-) Transcript_11135:89-802(-)
MAAGDIIGCGATGLAKSRFEEDVLHGRHSAVWGSWFDPSTRRWGYGCCRSTVHRSAGCSAASASFADAAAEGDAAVADGAALGEAQRAVLSWIVRALREWSDALGAREQRLLWDPALGQRLKLDEVKLKLRPLLKLLQSPSLSDALDATLLSTLEQIVGHASRREYQAANQVYMDCTIGHARWHEGFAKRQPPMGKVAGRISDLKFDANKTLGDPEAVDYLHSMKRLIALSQLLHPA